ncbi:Non-histone chromosomal protein 6, partial [Irineochytrium annulatum]
AAKGKGSRPGGAGKKKKDPHAPKRPLSAYMLWCKDNRDRIKEENPSAGFGDIGKILGREWKALDESDKEPYNQMMKKDKERYDREIENYSPADDDAEEAGGGGDEEDDE